MDASSEYTINLTYDCQITLNVYRLTLATGFMCWYWFSSLVLGTALVGLLVISDSNYLIATFIGIFGQTLHFKLN